MRGHVALEKVPCTVVTIVLSPGGYTCGQVFIGLYVICNGMNVELTQWYAANW